MNAFCIRYLIIFEYLRELFILIRGAEEIMKVAYITNIDISKSFGGSLGCLKFIKGLEMIYEDKLIDDYIVISISRSNDGSVEYHQRVILADKNKYLSTFTKRLHGNLSEIVLYYKEIIRRLKDFGPNVIILQTSFLGDFASVLKSQFPEVKIVGNFDNFELEYYKAFINKHNAFLRMARKLIEIPMVQRLEKKYLMSIDFATFLTNKDRESVFSHYGIEKPCISFPIMLEDPLTKVNLNHLQANNHPKIIFSGSLDYYPNIEAALFLESMSEIIKDVLGPKAEVIVAGRNPSKQLLKLKNIGIVATPSDSELTTLSLTSSLFVSPVFQGSGMKVKVIDALSHGLPIVASYHSLIGYEDVIDKAYIFPFRDKDVEDFKNALKKAREILDRKSKEEIFEIQRNTFKKYFSIENSKRILWEVFQNMQ